MARIPEAELIELKLRNPCDEVAARYVTLRKAGRRLVGPCPICSTDKHSRTASRFECDSEGWRCAVCVDGGDVVKLVRKMNGCDFREAIEILGGTRSIDAAEMARLEAIAKKNAEKRERQSAHYREQEREAAWEIWTAGKDIAETTVEAYHERRHLITPPGPVRALKSLGYFEWVEDGVDAAGKPRKKIEVIARAPARVLPILNHDGRFAGVHMTYLDLDRPSGKLALEHPQTGELLPAKKVRGSKNGNYTPIVRCADPHTLLVGEGYETVASAWRAHVELGRDLAGVAFWSSIDLGNLGGKAIETVKHPTAVNDKGRTVRVPGPVPDMAAHGLPIPPGVKRIVVLVDGDSDAFLTACAVARFAARYAIEGREIVAAWPPAGSDFNNLAPDWPGIMAIVDQAAPPAQPAIGAAETNDAPRKRRDRSTPSSSTTRASNETLDHVEDHEDPAPRSSADHQKKPSAPPAPPTEKEKRAQTLDGAGGGGGNDEALSECALLDPSDTDNGKRLDRYFGHDLTMMAQSSAQGEKVGEWLAWSGRHWDLDGGSATASMIAQQVGDLIKAEADFMAATDHEREAIDKAKAAKKELSDLEAAAAGGVELLPAARKRCAELEILILRGDRARSALQTRKVMRRKFGISSKNAAKVAAMLKMLAPHKRRSPDDFNRDAMLVATQSHTLRFWRNELEGGRVEADVAAIAAHRRDDLITALVPVAYDPAAQCPQWLKNLERFQPDPEQRRTIQQFTGLGLLGVPIQRLMYHYGTGGNFKSVFLEVITRTLGDSFAIGLPAESISGREERSAGQASPDLARVFGKRMLRVLELPDGQPLQAGTIKKLTGGEKWPVRTLFQGYFEFQPRAKTHMSGNSMPHFDGSDVGMKRRLIIVEWPVTIKEDEQRDFEIVVGELMQEASGILNWLIEGALDYLRNGLVVAKSIADLTREQVEEMDPIGQFWRECVVEDPEGPGVQARAMYNAYRDWSEASAKRVRSETKFGRDLRKLCRRDDSGHTRRWVGVKLDNVPANPRDERGRGRDEPFDPHSAPPRDDESPL